LDTYLILLKKMCEELLAVLSCFVSELLNFLFCPSGFVFFLCHPGFVTSTLMRFAMGSVTGFHSWGPFQRLRRYVKLPLLMPFATHT
jgi:hypothetical protein